MRRKKELPKQKRHDQPRSQPNGGSANRRLGRLTQCQRHNRADRRLTHTNRFSFKPVFKVLGQRRG